MLQVPRLATPPAPNVVQVFGFKSMPERRRSLFGRSHSRQTLSSPWKRLTPSPPKRLTLSINCHQETCDQRGISAETGDMPSRPTQRRSGPRLTVRLPPTERHELPEGTRRGQRAKSPVGFK